MTEDMYRVFQRINEIKTRFGLKRRTTIPSQVKAETKFEKLHDDAIAAVKKSEEKKISRAPYIDPLAKTPEEIKKLADHYAGKNKIPASLVKAVIETESGYKPDAISKKGAMGLMQLMPSVLQDFNVSDPFLPEENIRAGTGLLKNLLERYNWDYKKALAAYNAGYRAVDEHGGVPDFRETEEFVVKVIQSYLQNKD